MSKHIRRKVIRTILRSKKKYDVDEIIFGKELLECPDVKGLHVDGHIIVITMEVINYNGKTYMKNLGFIRCRNKIE